MRLSFSLLRLGLRNPTSLLSHRSPHLPSNPSYLPLCTLNGTPSAFLSSTRLSTLAPQQPSARVSGIVDEISGLTLLELADLTEALRSRLGVEQMPVMAVITPGMGIGGLPGVGGAAGAAKEAEEKKEEKMAFDLKLESFDAASKIKIIKEVRTFTDLGLKEAKELVEKAPTVLKTGLLKEEAEKIVEKMKEIGAKVVLE
ncbi:uncharacterized protein [Elaeis guineensis]|uniref:Uncharacterized protein LOC105053452 n=1 Tax=Elaeis guineensis var. tenera TaxID=51953 RepID=A0A6I9RUN2_ELAGV|nr:uncharacterized protein LOC105053452 [Elaeis guineensis]XP_010932907.1 uncharacterized protein LOC105053452 [Elaeis guineensis]XP_010932908.1 uncharacterized protein LOC105053452 [Elaeis guineensis]XP_019708664.1 uncharacterized protein LOC105053452 [Elaeis guineensis]